MNESTAQRIATYHGIRDKADGLLACWFESAAAAPDPSDPAPLSSTVLNLRRVVDHRCKLDEWEQNGSPGSLPGFFNSQS